MKKAWALLTILIALASVGCTKANPVAKGFADADARVQKQNDCLRYELELRKSHASQAQITRSLKVGGCE
jgi:hypothetical protein